MIFCSLTLSLSPRGLDIFPDTSLSLSLLWFRDKMKTGAARCGQDGCATSREAVKKERHKKSVAERERDRFHGT